MTIINGEQSFVVPPQSSCLQLPYVPKSSPEKLELFWMVRTAPELLSTNTETYCPD